MLKKQTSTGGRFPAARARLFFLEFKKLGKRDIQGFGNINQGVHAARADPRLNPLNKGPTDPVLSALVCQLLLGHTAFLAVIENIQANFNPFLIVAHIHQADTS